MIKRILLMSMTMLVAFSMVADSFAYLKLSTTSSDQTVQTNGLQITFNGGNLVATSSSGTL